jgi:hypothetical protein
MIRHQSDPGAILQIDEEELSFAQRAHRESFPQPASLIALRHADGAG